MPKRPSSSTACSARAALPGVVSRPRPNARIRISVGALMALGCLSARVTLAQELLIRVPGVGHEADGAGVAIANLDADPRPDIVLLAYDRRTGPNEFRYKVGWNLDRNGIAAAWGGIMQVPGVGHDGQGAGVAIANVDADPLPDMIVMAYDNAPGPNEFRYKIGWNLSSKGIAARWGETVQVTGVGHEAQGAGLAITNLDADPRPEMVLMAYDKRPEGNEFRYKIGFNLDSNGRTAKWGAIVHVAGVGLEAHGAGISVVNLDDNPRPEMVLLAYDNPQDANQFRYKIGWNLNASGVPAKWTGMQEVSGAGFDGQGADIAIADINGDSQPDHLLMAYDNPPGPNEFRYRVVLSVPRARPTAAIHGFADTHTHQFGNLAFGGLMLWGEPFHPGGIEGALPWCTPAHGPGGVGDLIGNAMTGRLVPPGHLVGGYPEFDGWPRYDLLTHQQMYHDWLHRAFLGGLKLVVVHAVNNEVFCGLANRTSSCNDMEAVERQLAAARDLERFIDERSGGPGQGWYRIARSGQEARQVINSGKLAVVLGIEVDHLFNCSALRGCTEEEVRRSLRKYYEAGVRHIIPIHLANNAFGGAALYNDAFNYNNKILTGSFFEVYDCSSAGTQFRFGLLGSTGRLWEVLSGASRASAPAYPNSGAHCNPRGLTPLGELLMREMMTLGMIIDIDHMSMRAADRALKIAEEERYPVVGGHTGFLEVALGNSKTEAQKTRGQLERIRRLGGLVSPILNQGSTEDIDVWGTRVANDCNTSSKSWAQAYLYAVEVMGGRATAAVGLGSDFNGFMQQPSPRFGDDACGFKGTVDPSKLLERVFQTGRQTRRISYPFGPFAGGPLLGPSQAANRTFDYNTDGVAHVGLLPDFIQDLRNVGLSDEDLAPLFRSAEAYVAMWERIDRGPRRP